LDRAANTNEALIEESTDTFDVRDPTPPPAPQKFPTNSAAALAPAANKAAHQTYRQQLAQQLVAAAPAPATNFNGKALAFVPCGYEQPAPEPDEIGDTNYH
jgi:hypothetical protein